MKCVVFLVILLCATNLVFLASANDTSTQVPTEAPNSTDVLETTAMGALETTSQAPLTSTVTQVTETTTSLPPTAPAPAFLVTPSDHCACDLTANSCDVNCCCDGDCTVEDAEAFHSCADKAPDNPDLRYCTKRDLVFSNRTLFEKRPVGDLLCIVVDNVKKKDVYGDPPAITTLAEAHSFVKDNPHTWRPMSSRGREMQVGFKAGSALLRVDDNSGRVEEWRLPTRLFSSRCESTEAISYLQDNELECRRRVGRLEQSCLTDPSLSASTYHSGFAVHSRREERTRIEAFVCSQGPCLAANATDSLPKYVDGACSFVVSHVSYRVFHNGADGIRGIEAHFELVTLPGDVTEFSQTFSVAFLWASKKEADISKFSGNPGYLPGLPILAGCFNQNGSVCGDQYSQRYLEVPVTRDGDCSSLASRTKLRFRYNFRTGCLLRPWTFKNCSAIQDALHNYIIGHDRYATHVASFGNANRSRIGDYAPILAENEPSQGSRSGDGSATTSDVCLLPATYVHVYVMHARTEEASRPQAKIVSALRRFGEAAEVRLYQMYPVEITYVAEFVDVSRRALQIFAPPPTIDARLPYDFFYPFFLESVGAKCRLASALWSLSFVVAFASSSSLVEHC